MKRAFGVLVLAVFMVAPSLAEATTWTFTKVADTSTAIPGGSGNFAGFGAPSIDSGNVAFWGSGTGQMGIYTNVGGSLVMVANLSTAIPGGSGNFTYFFEPSLDGGNAAFMGWGTGQEGIYTDVGGSLGVVADRNTAIPGGSGNFTNFGYPSLNGGNAAFNAVCLAPGQDGIYTDVGGSLGVVADTNTAIPGGTGNFTSFNNPSFDGGNVAFRGSGSGQSGIYTDVGGSLIVVADLTAAIPGGTGNFTAFSAYSLDGENVAFNGMGAGQAGIYIWHSVGALEKVIDLTDTLDGRTISGFYIWREALSGGAIAFRAVFSDGSSGIYIATPEPATVALMALGTLGTLLLKRKRR